MLIKRQPKLSWFINFLALLLISLLIANSILSSIYINNLKNRMSDITDNYFLAERKLQTALESLVQTRIGLLKYNLALKTDTSNDDFIKTKNELFVEFQKNEINLSSLILSLEKQEINGYMEEPISELYILVTQYLLNLENMLSAQRPTDPAQFTKEMDDSTATYSKIKEHLETLTEILRQRAYDVKNSDSLITQYFPPILLASFFIALILGGSFIYVSRREVRKSVLDQTAQILTEAHQYQQDCLQTLEICAELVDSGLNEKMQQAFETRKDLHKKEIASLENLLSNINALKKLT